jgi:hypothetical protein
MSKVWFITGSSRGLVRQLPEAAFHAALAELIVKPARRTTEA